MESRPESENLYPTGFDLVCTRHRLFLQRGGLLMGSVMVLLNNHLLVHLTSFVSSVQYLLFRN